MRIAEDVTAAVLDLTMGSDTAAAATRHYSPDFIQHSPIFPGGIEGLMVGVNHGKQLGASYEVLRAIGEGDQAVLHARVVGFAEVPLLMFNVYRLADGKIVEHWEGLQPESAGMADGPTEVTDPERSEENRTLVRDLVEKVFVGGDRSMLEDFVGADLIEHSPSARDGGAGVRDLLDDAADAPRHTRLHKVVVEGNFVYVLAEGTKGGAPHAFHHLFRVADGGVTEHWSVIIAIPEQLPHDNGVF
jgi:predicted SnoaL-like aldol condensation-catalyzing enzyme